MDYVNADGVLETRRGREEEVKMEDDRKWR